MADKLQYRDMYNKVLNIGDDVCYTYRDNNIITKSTVDYFKGVYVYLKNGAKKRPQNLFKL